MKDKKQNMYEILTRYSFIRLVGRFYRKTQQEDLVSATCRFSIPLLTRRMVDVPGESFCRIRVIAS